MTDRRSGPPLFDLMRERGQDPNAPKPTPTSPPPPSPAPAQSPKPITPGVGADSGPTASTQQTAWDTSGGVSRAERSAATMHEEEAVSDSGIRLSSPMFYTLMMIAIVLIIGAWTLGYQKGNKDGIDEMGQHVRDQPVVRANQPDSEQVVVPVTIPAQQEPSSTQGAPSGSEPAQNLASNASQTGVMSPSGFLEQDPRELGLNYLVLATLTTEQTADAILFMYSNSVTVIGVPIVDSGASGANNPSRYTLYSLGVAIPGNQWSAMSNARSQHQRLIANLGARWQREHRGASDFSQDKTNWEKYE